jgi:hypothetical protein
MLHQTIYVEHSYFGVAFRNFRAVRTLQGACPLCDLSSDQPRQSLLLALA